MRKLLAVVLTVLMLTSVLAVFPASAAESANTTPLLITEIMHNYSVPLPSDGTGAGDAAAYWEIYNNGDSPVNIYNLSLAQSPFYKEEPAATDLFFDNWNMWATQHAFFAKNDIKQGNIMFEGEEDKAEEFTLQNDIDNAELAPGEIAVLWFIKPSTITVLNDYVKENGIEKAGWDVREYFIDLYTTDSFTMNENTKIYLVWTGDTNTDAATDLPLTDRVYDDDCGSNEGYIFGLVSDTLELNTCVYDDAGNLSSEVYALAGFGGGVKNFASAAKARSHVYVPSNTKPDYYNALLNYRGTETDADYADYKAAGCVESFDIAAILETNLPTNPGALTNLQWVYIAPDKAPSELTGAGENWAAEYVKSYLAETFPDLSNLEDPNVEDLIEVNPPDQNKLMELFYPKPPKKPTASKGGLGTGAIIGIVAGGVVVAAAAAVAVVLVVKKKKAA